MFNYMTLMEKLHARLAADSRPDRTNTGTASIFGTSLEFDLRESFPLLPFRQMNFKDIVTELVWFLRGETNIKFLEDNGCKWWSNQCSKKGEVGPMYGAQWRGYTDRDGSIKPDQFARAVNTLVNDPFSRRILVDSWEASKIPENNCDYDENVENGKMAIAPCHPLYQFYVEEIDGKRHLSCKFDMRSSDTFLGLPANIASYALLTHIVAGLTDMVPYRLCYGGGDVHLYSNHDKACTELLRQWREDIEQQMDERGISRINRYRKWEYLTDTRCPKYQLPEEFLEKVTLEDLDFKVEGLVELLVSGLSDYKPQPPILARMAR